MSVEVNETDYEEAEALLETLTLEEILEANGLDEQMALGILISLDYIDVDEDFYEDYYDEDTEAGQ